MKTTILITLLMMLIPSAVIGQNELQSVLSYNKADSTLTVMVKNISNKPITIQNQSSYSIAPGGSVIEFWYKDKDRSVGSISCPLASSLVGDLWPQFLVIAPGVVKYGDYSQGSIYCIEGSTSIEATLTIAYFFKDSLGRFVFSSHRDSLIIE